MDNIDIGKLLTVITGFIEAPTWKAVAVIFGIIALGFVYIVMYFREKNQREREAYEYSLKIRMTQEENLARMQKDISSALIENIDIAYKQDFDYYVKKMGLNDYKAIYMKAPLKFHEKISQFLYKTDLSAPEKAALIIDLIRRGL